MKKLIYAGLFSAAIAPAVAQLPSCTPTGNLVAYWTMDANVNDASGNGNHGTATMGVVPTVNRKGIPNTAISIAPVGMIWASSLTPCWTSSQNMTISAWIKTSKGGERQEIVQFGSKNTNQGFTMHVEPNGTLRCDFTNRVGPSSAVAVNDGQWHFVSATITNGTVQIYVDGEVSGSPQAMTPAFACGPFYIGKYGGASDSTTFYQFVGSLDDVSVYSRSLLPHEIRKLGGLPATNFVTPPAVNVCSGTPTSYSVRSVPGATAYTWYVDGSNVATSTTANHTITWTAAQVGSHELKVLVTDACASNSPLITTVNVTAKPVVAIAGNNSVCSNQQLQLSGSPSGGTWSSSNLSVATVNATGLVAGFAAGTTTISLTVVNGPCTASATKNVSVISCRLEEDGEESPSELPILVYPNPTKGAFVIQTQGQPGYASILDVTGQPVREIELLQGKTTYPVEIAEAGVYMVRLQSGSQTKGYKIVVE